MSIKRPCVYWIDGYCKKFSNNEVTSWCVDGPCNEETPSNADRIRAMTDEELAKWFGHFTICGQIQTNEYEWCETNGTCTNCVLRWLKQPAKEET